VHSKEYNAVILLNIRAVGAYPSENGIYAFTVSFKSNADDERQTVFLRRQEIII
jgi:hypothetical protein